MKGSNTFQQFGRTFNDGVFQGIFQGSSIVRKNIVFLHQRKYNLVDVSKKYIFHYQGSLKLLEEAKKILAEGKYFFKCSSQQM